MKQYGLNGHRIMLSISIFLMSTTLFAAQPLLSIIALYKAPASLAPNSFTAAIYKVTNTSGSANSFVMQAIPGVTQVTTMFGACTNPFQLGIGESCQLNLRIIGSQLAGNLSTGPIICNNVSQPMGCSQPSPSDSLSLNRLTTPLVQNNWISVLVADDPPPVDLATYMNQIISLAPSLTQIHFRFPAGGASSLYSSYVDLITLFRTAYSAPIEIGFHPDNSDSTDDYNNWNCTPPPPSTAWQCILNKSIMVMNSISALVDPNHTGQGFNIYSIEQSYVEPATAVGFTLVKSCLNPSATPGTTCPPEITIASPVVKYGDVLQSFGESDFYGTNALDYGYPQFYNLGKQIGPYTALIDNGFLPPITTSCFTPPYSSHLYVVDEDNNTDHPYSPQIPCNNPANVFVYTDPATGHAPDVSVATAYLAYLMTQYIPIQSNPTTNGATVYVTFSGEGEGQAPSLFLGAPGWALDKILAFYAGINADLQTLYHLYPPSEGDPMFANGIFSDGIDPTKIQYAIWNFTSILENI